MPSPVPTNPPAGGIEAYPLGALCGEYAFVLNGGAITLTGPSAVAEIWAIPLAGGDPRLAVRYVNAASLAGMSKGDNVLPQQLSTDGRRLVLSVVTPRASGGTIATLFVVDLESGRATRLGSDDATTDLPAWSPDGKQIAYRRPGGSSNEGIWVVNADGTAARQAITIKAQGPGSALHLAGWAADGRLAWFAFPAVLTLTDIASGAETRVGQFVGDARGLSFRSAAPRIAGSFADTLNCPGSYVLMADGAPERILVREPDGVNCPNWIHNVRWNPTRDEVIYLVGRSPKSELYIHELSGGTQRVAAQAEPVLAEWSAAGTHLLYVHRNAPEQFGLPLRGGELRYVRRDGSDDRTIFAPRGLASLSDLAVRLYP